MNDSLHEKNDYGFIQKVCKYLFGFICCFYVSFTKLHLAFLYIKFTFLSCWCLNISPYQGWWRDLLHANNYKELDYSGKMVLLLDIITMCSDVGDKALVFSQSIPTLDLIELYFSRLPRRGKKGKFWKKGKDWYRCVYISGNLLNLFDVIPLLMP